MTRRQQPVVQPQDDSIRHIPLTQGMVAIVDASEFGDISRFNWYVIKSHHTFYAARWKDGKHLLMHRYLLPSENDVDHRDGDGLNNRRSNLRPATNSQQRFNQKAYKNNRSGAKGVWKDSVYSRYRACIRVEGKIIGLGSFRTLEEASRAYREACIKYHGEFARPS